MMEASLMKPLQLMVSMTNLVKTVLSEVVVDVVAARMKDVTMIEEAAAGGKSPLNRKRKRNLDGQRKRPQTPLPKMVEPPKISPVAAVVEAVVDITTKGSALTVVLERKARSSSQDNPTGRNETIRKVARQKVVHQEEVVAVADPLAKTVKPMVSMTRPVRTVASVVAAAGVEVATSQEVAAEASLAIIRQMEVSSKRDRLRMVALASATRIKSNALISQVHLLSSKTLACRNKHQPSARGALSQRTVSLPSRLSERQ